MELSAAEQFVLTISEKGFGKRTSSYEYRTTGRGGKGIVAMAITEKNGRLVASFPIEETDQIMLVTDGGQLIRCPVDGIRIAGRSTQGVIVFSTAEGEKVASVERLSEESQEAEESGELGYTRRCSLGRTMDVAYLSAMSALAGSVVGGLTSSLTTWITQRSQAKASYLAREMSRRDDLYKDFIIAASKAYGDAVVSSELQIQDLIALYAMVSRMRVQSSSGHDRLRRKCHDADDGHAHVAEQNHRGTIRTSEDREDIDPLKDFSEAARAEMLEFVRR